MNSTITPPVKQRRFPEWLRMNLPTEPEYARTRGLIKHLHLATVCESAKCPNQWECWQRGTATFMIAGERCTRACGFCAVDTRKPLPLDPDEPERVAEAAKRMNLRHIVITAVARDDIEDGGAEHFRQTIEAVRNRISGIYIEVLVPDFNNRDASIQTVLDARPDIYNHNIETVPRLTKSVRHRATYERSLDVLSKAKIWGHDGMFTKSGMMVGLGETESEVNQSMQDLRGVNCDIVTIGQYLQPTPKHLPVTEFIKPAQFHAYREMADKLGFIFVASGPLVRSSYHADDFQPQKLKLKS